MLSDWSIPYEAAGCLLVNSDVLSGHYVSRGQCKEKWKQSEKG